MTNVVESMEGVTNGVAITNAQLASGVTVIKAASGTATGDSSWAYPGAGSKSALVSCPSAADAVYFRAATGFSTLSALAIAIGMKWNTLPSPGSGSQSKLVTARNSTTFAAFVRYGGNATSSGNVFQVVDSASAVKATSPAFTAGNRYFISLTTFVGTDTTNGRIRCSIWENDLLWFDYDSADGVVAINTGTTALIEPRGGKQDTSATLNANFDYFTADDSITSVITPPNSSSASANAGPDSVVEAYQNWQAGDGNITRAFLDSSGSTFTGPGTPTRAWSAPVGSGITFSDPTGVSTWALIPNKLVDTTYAISVTTSIGSSTPSTDAADVTVKASTLRTPSADGSAWEPSRKVYY